VSVWLLFYCGRRSKHEEISLVSVEQFYEEATEDISKPVSSFTSHCLLVRFPSRDAVFLEQNLTFTKMAATFHLESVVITL